MSVCDCNVGLSNTGTTDCLPVMSVTKKVIMVRYYDDDGNVNSVDCNDTLDLAYFTAKVNEADKSKRWYPMPQLKNVEDTKADSIFESFNDGSNLFIQEGVRTFTGVMPLLPPAYLGQIKAARCSQIGVFLVDKEGNLIGNGSVDGFLYPILVDQNTWNPVLMKATDTTVQKIMLTYEFDRIEKDEDLRMLTSSSLDYDVLKLQGINDVVVTGLAATESNQTIVGTLESIFGDQCNKIKFKGLDLADFTILVNDVAGTISSVTESPDGTYSIVMNAASFVATDSIELQVSKDGYEVVSGGTTTAVA